MRIMILNGPNLNMLGIREPHVDGSTTLAAIRKACEEFAARAGVKLSFHQSNHEGVLVDLIQSARTEADALIINPGDYYSFTPIAMFDALKIFAGPIFEVHISDIHACDELHRHAKLSAAVKGVIAGLGPYGYIVAMPAVLQGAGKLPGSFRDPGGADVMVAPIGSLQRPLCANNERRGPRFGNFGELAQLGIGAGASRHGRPAAAPTLDELLQRIR